MHVSNEKGFLSFFTVCVLCESKLILVLVWVFLFCHSRTINQNTHVAIYLFRIFDFIFVPRKLNENNLNRTCVRIGNNGWSVRKAIAPEWEVLE